MNKKLLLFAFLSILANWTPEVFSQGTQAMAVRIVKSLQASAYEDDLKSIKHHNILNEGESVGVLQEKNGFVLAEFTPHSGQPTTGWLRASDLYLY